MQATAVDQVAFRLRCAARFVTFYRRQVEFRCQRFRSFQNGECFLCLGIILDGRC